MTMRDFIKNNREELDECIQRACPGAPKNDEERVRINNAVYEMWHPHRRVSTELGMERSARAEVTTLVDRRTGRRRTVRAQSAAKVARKAGMVEPMRYRGKRLMVSDANGVLWKRVGEEEWARV